MLQQDAEKPVFPASSFDKLRMTSSVIEAWRLMVSLSWFGELTMRPWATAFFSGLLEWLRMAGMRAARASIVKIVRG
jgi:hypothetical protein